MALGACRSIISPAAERLQGSSHGALTAIVGLDPRRIAAPLASNYVNWCPDASEFFPIPFPSLARPSATMNDEMREKVEGGDWMGLTGCAV